MSVTPMEPRHPADADLAEDMIDLRRYVGVLGSWWREILLLGVLAALAAGGGFWLLSAGDPPVYTASADVAIVRTVSELTFDERFTTQPESVAATNAAARRNALLALAGHPALAIAVVDALGDALPEELREPALLAQYVDAALATTEGIRADSDLIRITAESSSPETSAQIATAWARAYVANVNQVYGQVPNELLTSIGQELSVTEANYAAAQSALEAYTARSRIDELSRLISDIEQRLNALRRGRQETLNVLIDRSVEGRDRVAQSITNAQADNLALPYLREQEGRRAIVLATIDALYSGQEQVITEQARRDRELLTGYYTRWMQVTRAAQEAEALRVQVAAGGEEASGGSALVLSLLKLQAFTQALDTQESQQLDLVTQPDVRISAQAGEATAASAAPGMVQSAQPVQVQVGATPLQLQLDDRATVERTVLLADIDALIGALDARRVVLEDQILELSRQLRSGASYQFTEPVQTDVSALGQALQEQLPSLLLNSSVLSGTAASFATENAALAALFQLDEVQALVDATGGDQRLQAMIAEMEEQVRSLNAQLEAEHAERTRLAQKRDFALDAYRTVNSKIAELTLSRAAGSSEVRFAAPAVASLTPVSTLSPLLVALAAAVAGVLLGVVVAFIADAVGGAPFLARGRRAAARPV